jgi:hypothetical protein
MSIIQLNQRKILYYLEWLSGRPEIRATVERIRSSPRHLMTVLDSQSDIDIFTQWITLLSDIASLTETESVSPQLIATYLRWAAEAKWRHSEALEVSFNAEGQDIAPWIFNVYKLGRYSIAAKAMVRVALTYPARFCPMSIETIEASPVHHFFLDEEKSPLTHLLRRTVG